MASTPVRNVAVALVAALAFMTVSCASAPPAPKETSLTDLVLQGDLDGIKKFYSNQEQLNSRDA
ncbi:MAG: hypothetical protein ABFC75_05945, partial [Rectinema sp.]